MPTGYTAPVEDGEITELKDFAALCARAFGCFMHQREDSLSTGLKMPQEPTDSYLRDSLSKAELERQRWKGLSEEEKYAEWSKYYTKTLAENASRRAEILTKNARHYAMLAQVEATEVPSQLQEFKNFMVEQLTMSLTNDSDRWYHISEYVEWCENKEESIERDLKYYSERLADEWARYDKQVAYIKVMADTFGFEVEK